METKQIFIMNNYRYDRKTFNNFLLSRAFVFRFVNIQINIHISKCLNNKQFINTVNELWAEMILRETSEINTLSECHKLFLHNQTLIMQSAGYKSVMQKIYLQTTQYKVHQPRKGQ